MTREEIRIIAMLILAWILYRGWKRHELRHALLAIVSVIVVIALGVFIVIYGKLWHAWIFGVKDMPGAKG